MLVRAQDGCLTEAWFLCVQCDVRPTAQMPLKLAPFAARPAAELSLPRTVQVAVLVIQQTAVCLAEL